VLRLGPHGVEGFEEKPSGDGNWINGGYFVLEPGVFDYIDGDATHWELEPMERLVAEHQLGAYRHPGFWQPMDTLRDRNHLEHLWAAGRAPWQRW
jgi:glucose-1-phosphate cytidylyltransferase